MPLLLDVLVLGVLTQTCWSQTWQVCTPQEGAAGHDPTNQTLSVYTDACAAISPAASCTWLWEKGRQAGSTGGTWVSRQLYWLCAGLGVCFVLGAAAGPMSVCSVRHGASQRLPSSIASTLDAVEAAGEATVWIIGAICISGSSWCNAEEGAGRYAPFKGCVCQVQPDGLVHGLAGVACDARSSPLGAVQAARTCNLHSQLRMSGSGAVHMCWWQICICTGRGWWGCGHALPVYAHQTWSWLWLAGWQRGLGSSYVCHSSEPADAQCWQLGPCKFKCRPSAPQAIFPPCSPAAASRFVCPQHAGNTTNQRQLATAPVTAVQDAHATIEPAFSIHGRYRHSCRVENPAALRLHVAARGSRVG